MTRPNDLTPLIIEGIPPAQKGRNITLIDMSGIETAATPHFIICEGTSSQKLELLPTVCATISSRLPG